MVALEAVAAAGKRKPQLLPRTFRKELAKLTRRCGQVFEGKPTLKDVAVRFFRAQLHRRSGRPCDQNVTTAIRLLRRYLRIYPTESYAETWSRIYPTTIPGLDGLPPRETSDQKRRLRSAVRARQNARRRRATRAKQ